MKIEHIEVVLVLIVVFFQFRVFAKTLKQIKLYKHAIPALSAIKIGRYRVEASRLQSINPEQLLDELEAHNDALEASLPGEGESLDFPPADKLNISIITSTGTDGVVFENVKHALNRYLVRNHGAATDFNLIKDVVERNVGALEEDINLTISLPLYLGLMGTMIGIVIGLFNIPDLNLVLDNAAKDAQLSTGISLLIGGVKIAMLASFVGLLLTIVSSGWLFKGSRSLVEYRKNDFYTFVQTELLPVINHSIGSTLASFQRNLQLFNGEFTQNLDRLSGIFSTNFEAITAQERVLAKLEEIDLAKMAKFNITVFQELQKSTGEFQQFNQYLHSMNAFLGQTQLLVSKADSLMERTGNFEDIANSLNNKLEQGQALLDFLYTHFEMLDNHKVLVNNAVADVGHYMSGTFQELRQHISHSTDSVRQFTVDEIDALKNALSESKTNLSNLSYLEGLDRNVSQFKTEASTQSEQIANLLSALDERLISTAAMLNELRKNSLTYQVKSLFSKEKN